MLKEKGQALIEFALMLSAFLLLMLGGADLLWFEIEKGSVNFIAQQAAICNAQGTCDVQSYVKRAAVGFNLDQKAIAVKINNQNNVQVTYDAHPFTGFLGRVTLTTVAITPK